MSRLQDEMKHIKEIMEAIIEVSLQITERLSSVEEQGTARHADRQESPEGAVSTVPSAARDAQAE